MWKWILRESVLKFEPNADDTSLKFEVGEIWIIIALIKCALLLIEYSDKIMVFAK